MKDLNPGGAIPQSLSGPDWNGGVKREPWRDMNLSAASTRNIWIRLLPMRLH